MRDRVLIVDDDEDIQLLLEAYLRKNGFDAQAVGDGKAMWEALAAKPVSMVVLDLMLPGEDGLAQLMIIFPSRSTRANCSLAFATS